MEDYKFFDQYQLALEKAEKDNKNYFTFSYKNNTYEVKWNKDRWLEPIKKL